MRDIEFFDFEIDQYGARIVAKRDPLTWGCETDEEVDQLVKLLKEDLDDVARRMKQAARGPDHVFWCDNVPYRPSREDMILAAAAIATIAILVALVWWFGLPPIPGSSVSGAG